MNIFCGVSLRIVHFVLLGKDFLVVGAVVEEEIGDDETRYLVLLTKVDEVISKNLAKKIYPL